MTTDRRSITVTTDAADLRRNRGPAAWFVLEAMLFEATATSDGYTSLASVRSLAERVGLAKNTVARATARLRAAGLVSARQSRSSAGTLGTGAYVLTLPPSISVRAERSARPTTCRSNDEAQLALPIGS